MSSSMHFLFSGVWGTPPCQHQINADLHRREKAVAAFPARTTSRSAREPHGRAFAFQPPHSRVHPTSATKLHRALISLLCTPATHIDAQAQQSAKAPARSPARTGAEARCGERLLVCMANLPSLLPKR